MTPRQAMALAETLLEGFYLLIAVGAIALIVLEWL